MERIKLENVRIDDLNRHPTITKYSKISDKGALTAAQGYMLTGDLVIIEFDNGVAGKGLSKCHVSAVDPVKGVIIVATDSLHISRAIFEQ